MGTLEGAVPKDSLNPSLELKKKHTRGGAGGSPNGPRSKTCNKFISRAVTSFSATVQNVHCLCSLITMTLSFTLNNRV
jgi:hypothetical protein